MKTKLILTLASLMFIVMASIASAQGTVPCVQTPPDCPLTPFVLQPIIAVTLPNGCVVQLTFRSRCACGVFNDFVLESILVPNSPSCNVLTAQTIVDQTAIAFIQQFFGNTPPCGGALPQCPVVATNWRALRGSCVYTDSFPDGTRIVRYCDGAACCWQTYNVCRDAQGNVIATAGPSFNATSCPGVGPAGQRCETACPQH